jgi:nitroreductase
MADIVPEFDRATVDSLLTTTRAVRKRLDLDRPVEPEVIEECLRIAIQAPTGGNAQGWRFVVVTDAAKRKRIAELYRDTFTRYRAGREDAAAAAGRVITEQQQRVTDSSQYLADHLHEVPVYVIPCILGRLGPEATTAEQASFYGSILPAVWNLQLALRSRGLGSAWTTLHLPHEAEVAGLLGIPDTVTQVALIPVAYYTGDGFRQAGRRPAREITYWDTWKAPR